MLVGLGLGSASIVITLGIGSPLMWCPLCWTASVCYRARSSSTCWTHCAQRDRPRTDGRGTIPALLPPVG